jgi:hypothetical protein
MSVINQIFFTGVEKINGKVTVKGKYFHDQRTEFIAEVSCFAKMPKIDVNEGTVILPYQNKFYIVSILLENSMETHQPIDFNYSEYMPAFVYAVMCGMVATDL